MKFAFLMGLIFVATAQASECPKFEVAEHVMLNPVVYTNTFNIHAAQKLNSQPPKFYGKLVRKFLSWNPVFELYNSSGQKVATTSQKDFVWGTEVQVFDCNQNQIGRILELAWGGVLYPRQSRFSFYSGKIRLADSKSAIPSDNTVDVDSHGESELKIFKGSFDIYGEVWQVASSSLNLIDPRVYMILPAYKTYANEKRESQKPTED